MGAPPKNLPAKWSRDFELLGFGIESQQVFCEWPATRPTCERIYLCFWQRDTLRVSTLGVCNYPNGTLGVCNYPNGALLYMVMYVRETARMPEHPGCLRR